MRYRPSPGFLWSIMTMALVAVGCLWAWSKADSAPLEMRKNGDFWEALKRKKSVWDVPPRETAEDRRVMREQAEAMRQEMWLKFPELKLESRKLAAEDNGFLQMHLLSGSPFVHTLRFGPKLEAALAEEEWNAEKVEEALAEDEGWVEKIEKVALLPGRSTAGMPDTYDGFIAARSIRKFHQVLLMRARLAAEAGDEEEALRMVGAASNLAMHLRGIEERNLLGETVFLLLEKNTLKEVFESILPALGRGADVARWREVTKRERCEPGDFAELMKGEWNSTFRFFLVPMILRQKPRDGEALIQVHAKGFQNLLKVLEVKQWEDFAEDGCSALTASDEGLSSESREMLRTLQVGVSAWHRGYVRSASVFAMYDGALELLEREQAGEVLEDDRGVDMPMDPVVGQAYRFEVKERLLYAPSGLADEVDPVKLPW